MGSRCAVYLGPGSDPSASRIRSTDTGLNPDERVAFSGIAERSTHNIDSVYFKVLAKRWKICLGSLMGCAPPRMGWTQREKLSM